MSEYIITGEQLERLGVPDMFTEQEIVRCRDCGCFDEETSLCNRLGKFPEWHACTEPDGYCKWGKRWTEPR